MNNLIQRTDQEILMGFVASCIEDVAEKLGVDYAVVYERMKAVDSLFEDRQNVARRQEEAGRLWDIQLRA